MMHQQQQSLEDRIGVVADPATNSLLVRASPIDMLGIRRLLNTSIDVDTVDSRAVIKTWIIPLMHASATEVANVIRDVYREHMDKNAVTGGFGGFGGRRG